VVWQHGSQDQKEESNTVTVISDKLFTLQNDSSLAYRRGLLLNHQQSTNKKQTLQLWKEVTTAN